MCKENYEAITIGQTERNAGVSRKLFVEKLNFMNGRLLRLVDVTLENGSIAKKVRRIVEKRTCQYFYRQNRSSFRRKDNQKRHLMKRAVSYELHTLGQIEDDGEMERGASTHWKREFDDITGKPVLRKKTVYQTFSDAHRAAIDWNFKHKEDRGPVYPYQCAYCHKYHIGHHGFYRPTKTELIYA